MSYPPSPETKDDKQKKGGETPTPKTPEDNLREWVSKKRKELESKWMVFPVSDLHEKGEEKDLESFRNNGAIKALSYEEEGKLSSLLRSESSPYKPQFCITKESFERRYQEALGHIKIILNEGKFHKHYLDLLLREVANRIFFMDPPREVIVYYSKSKYQIVVWSSWDLDTLYRNMRALS